MSIEPLPQGGHRVRWRDGAGIHRSKTFYKGEHHLAKALDGEMKRHKRLGHLPQLEASKVSVGQMAAEWWTNHGSLTAPRTSSRYDQLLQKLILPHFDSAGVSAVKPTDIEAWMAALDTGVPTKRKALGILSQVFNYAMRAGHAQGNPCSVAIRPKLPDREPINPPAPLEVERIRKALFDRDRPGDAYMVGTLAYAGLRTQELRDLTWFAVRENTILARSSKTGKHRAVDIVPALAADLDQWRKMSDGTEVVFPTATGLRFTKTTWDNWRNRVWDGTEKKPGVAYDADFTPYALRHTFVSLLLRDPNRSLIYAAEQAGHSLQVQDERYAHVIMEGTGPMEDAIYEARAEVFGERKAAHG